MGKGVAQFAQSIESPLHSGIDQAQATGQYNLGADGAQGAIRHKKAIALCGCRSHHRLQQMLQGRIHAGHAYEHSPPAPLFQHLQGDLLGGLGNGNGAGISGHGDQAAAARSRSSS